MYNFKKNAKAYIVEVDQNSGVPTTQHTINIYPDITASQTFEEQGYKRKTLHSLNDLHDYAVVNKANVANFSFTTPIQDISSTPVVLKLGGDYSSGTIVYFDLYIESDNVIYQLKKAAIETLTFNIEMKSILTVSISGSGAKLSKFGNVGSVTIPGTPYTESSTKSYTRIDSMSVSIGGLILDSIAAVHIDIKNDLSWYNNNTLNDAIADNIMYPGSYVLQSRTFSGSITQFLTSANVDTISDTSTSSAVVLSIYCNSYSSTNPLIQFNLPSTVFTRRINFEDLINRVYDFRLNSNLTTVKPIYKGV